MQIFKFVASSLAVASMTAASPVAQGRNQTLSYAMTQSNNDDDDSPHFQVFGRSSALPFDSTAMEQNVFDQTESSFTQAMSHKRHLAGAVGDEGRPGKVPYRKFPPCYVDCFDSEGVTSKTSMFIGDIRDLTTDEFCNSKQGWVGSWVFDHLQFCVHGACRNCPDCGQKSGKVYEEICGHKFCERCG